MGLHPVRLLQDCATFPNRQAFLHDTEEARCFHRREKTFSLTVASGQPMNCLTELCPSET
jgi:hypothetical protein